MQSNGITFNTSNSNFPSCCFPPDEEPRRVSRRHINKCLLLLVTSPLQSPTVSPRHHGCFPASPYLSHQSSHWICVVVYSQVAVRGVLKQYWLGHNVSQSLIKYFFPYLSLISILKCLGNGIKVVESQRSKNRINLSPSHLSGFSLDVISFGKQ